MPDKHEILWVDSADLKAGKWDKTAATRPVCLALPWIDQDQVEATLEILSSRAGFAAAFVLIKDSDQSGPARLINEVFSQTDSAVFGYLAQDVFPSRNWLAVALAAIQKKPQIGLIAFNDGKWAGQLASFGLVTRKWADSIYGGKSLFYPQYVQHFGDTELTLIAREQNAYGYEPNCIMMEIDPKKESKGVNDKDRALFNHRKLDGFEGRVSRVDLLGLFG